MSNFSVVVPIRNEVKLIEKNLPSYIGLNPRELIICLDKPPCAGVRDKVEEVVKKYHFSEKTRILEIDNSGWNYKMAKVRRIGFINAKCDVLFTGDIDCMVNKNCLKAIEMVGRDNVGIVSVTRFYLPHGLIDVYRLVGWAVIKKYVHGIRRLIGRKTASQPFSGTYALYKPYWLDSEPLAKIKAHKSVKQLLRRGEKISSSSIGGVGEDSHLRDYMLTKHKVVCLEDIGAFVTSDPYENLPAMQFSKGVYFSRNGRSLVISIARAVLRCQPYYLIGALWGMKNG